MSSPLEPTVRPGNLGYIDEPQSPQIVTPIIQGVCAQPFDEEYASAASSSSEESSGSRPRSLRGSDSEVDWDTDGEDWDLATGDFTKQYNRSRQAAAATGTSAARPVLPARNQLKAETRISLGIHNPKFAGDRHDKDKSDRATQEQVLDARTRLVLTGFVNRGVVGKVDDCISTGKEANVYHATSDTGPLAVKIYRTSILAFRSRASYIVGEQRFKGEYTSSKNPRKMVRVWAEKELRNLRRLEQGGVLAPRAVEVKQNVLVMEFLGKEDNASPRLKDADFPPEDAGKLYVELLVSVWRMFHKCKLVHADLSEYNLLYHRGHIYIIDVSQSVEEDHPRAFEFLRHDLSNVERFFSMRTKTLGVRRAWEYVIDPSHNGNPEAIIQRVEESHDPSDDAVFLASFMPRNLQEVTDPERDIQLLQAGRGEELIYAGVTRLSLGEGEGGDPASVGTVNAASDEGEIAAGEDPAIQRSRGFRHEDRQAKKDRKAAVKEENRERRKVKMPKSEKQRLIRKTAK